MSGFTLHTYECHLLKKFENHPKLAREWLSKLEEQNNENTDDDSLVLGDIPLLAVTSDKNKNDILTSIKEWLDHMGDPNKSMYKMETPLEIYMNHHFITRINIDGIFKYGDDNTLPPELFRCRSVKWLSMKYNYLDKLPADIGSLSSLEHLELTNNKLQNKSLPFSLTFCRKLETLRLDNNLLDALPGFLLEMHALKTVHRHGNHNYFKSTFMWYHTDVNQRILKLAGTMDGVIDPNLQREPKSLQFWAAKSVISMKVNFYAEQRIPPALKDYIGSVYHKFNVCGCCKYAKPITEPGYKVITFKNPYLGNTCVPFQHWACSHPCAQALEIPARFEQIEAAERLDREYDTYVHDCRKQQGLSLNSTARRITRSSRIKGCGCCLS